MFIAIAEQMKPTIWFLGDITALYLWKENVLFTFLKLEYLSDWEWGDEKTVTTFIWQKNVFAKTVRRNKRDFKLQQDVFINKVKSCDCNVRINRKLD